MLFAWAHIPYGLSARFADYCQDTCKAPEINRNGGVNSKTVNTEWISASFHLIASVNFDFHSKQNIK